MKNTAKIATSNRAVAVKIGALMVGSLIAATCLRNAQASTIAVNEPKAEVVEAALLSALTAHPSSDKTHYPICCRERAWRAPIDLRPEADRAAARVVHPGRRPSRP